MVFAAYSAEKHTRKLCRQREYQSSVGQPEYKADGRLRQEVIVCELEPEVCENCFVMNVAAALHTGQGKYTVSQRCAADITCSTMQTNGKL